MVMRVNFMKRFLILGTALSLSACVSPMTRQETLNIYRSNCLDYGFQWGTPQFAKCVEDQEYQGQKLNIEARKARALEDQAWERTHNQYIYVEDNSYYPRKKYKSRGVNYPVQQNVIQQNVKQKIHKKSVHNTNIQNTTIQHTYHQPQTSVVPQELPPAPPSSPQSFSERNSLSSIPPVETPPTMNSAPLETQPEINQTPPVSMMEQLEMAPPPALQEMPKESIPEFIPPLVEVIQPKRLPESALENSPSKNILLEEEKKEGLTDILPLGSTS